MSLESTKQTRIELLESMLNDLHRIESRVETQEVELTEQQFQRWKERNIRLVAERFGKDEAQTLSRYKFPQKRQYFDVSQMYSDLLKPFRASQAFLQSLLDEISEHGESYYDERASIRVLPLSEEREIPVQQEALPSPEEPPNKSTTEGDFEQVSLAWLFHRVPAKFWVWLSGVLITFFIAGISVGQLKLVKEFNRKDESTQHTLRLSPEELKSKIDQLIQGHNERAAKIQAAILDEEKLAGDHNLPPYYQESHSKAAQKLRGDLAGENEVFLKDVSELKSLEK